MKPTRVLSVFVLAPLFLALSLFAPAGGALGVPTLSRARPLHPGAVQRDSAQATGQAAPAATKPHIAVLATGGTIASSQSASGVRVPGTQGVQGLLAAVPQVNQFAQVTGEDVVNVESQDMTDAIWLQLANRVNAVLSQPDVNGVVITHGTDTMEETAYFLHLVVRSDKPVVMTGAMRTSDAVAADGPANLLDAVQVAAAPQAAGRGVMVVMNDQVFDARDVTKTNNMRLDAFQSPNRGPEGLVAAGYVVLYAKPTTRYGLQSDFSVDNVSALPSVEIFYASANMGRAQIDDAVQRGVKGIVIAGVGNGNLSQVAIAGLADAVKQGVAVVRSSRVESGAVARDLEVDDDANGFVVGLDLNPQKARALLMLGLLQTNDPSALQQLFYQY